jgi:hypothetical protein
VVYQVGFVSQNVGFAVAAAINQMLLMAYVLGLGEVPRSHLVCCSMNGLKMYESSIKRFVGGES